MRKTIASYGVRIDVVWEFAAVILSNTNSRKGQGGCLFPKKTSLSETNNGAFWEPYWQILNNLRENIERIAQMRLSMLT